jgi:hypothetical protein
MPRPGHPGVPGQNNHRHPLAGLLGRCRRGFRTGRGVPMAAVGGFDQVRGIAGVHQPGG